MDTLTKAEKQELDDSIAALVTPESQAWADYVNGGDLSCNPYLKHSDKWVRYQIAMSREQDKELKRMRAVPNG